MDQIKLDDLDDELKRELNILLEAAGAAAFVFTLSASLLLLLLWYGHAQPSVT